MEFVEPSAGRACTSWQTYPILCPKWLSQKLISWILFLFISSERHNSSLHAPETTLYRLSIPERGIQMRLSAVKTEPIAESARHYWHAQNSNNGCPGLLMLSINCVVCWNVLYFSCSIFYARYTCGYRRVDNEGFSEATRFTQRFQSNSFHDLLCWSCDCSERNMKSLWGSRRKKQEENEAGECLLKPLWRASMSRISDDILCAFSCSCTRLRHTWWEYWCNFATVYTNFQPGCFPSNPCVKFNQCNAYTVRSANVFFYCLVIRVFKSPRCVAVSFCGSSRLYCIFALRWNERKSLVIYLNGFSLTCYVSAIPALVCIVSRNVARCWYCTAECRRCFYVHKYQGTSRCYRRSAINCMVRSIRYWRYVQ